jgi:hypothetical protein
MKNMTATSSSTVFVLTDWDAERKMTTVRLSFIVDTDSPSPILKQKMVPILHGVQEWKRSDWEAAKIGPISEYINTKQLILVFDGDDPWSGRIDVEDRFGRIEFNQIIDKVPHVGVLEDWHIKGKLMSFEEAKHFSNLDWELNVIEKQIKALKENNVDLPRIVNCFPEGVKPILKEYYNFSTEEQKQIVSKMFSSRRTPSKIEEIGQLIKDKTLSREEIVEMVELVGATYMPKLPS